jgi:hypothetical protein
MIGFKKKTTVAINVPKCKKVARTTGSAIPKYFSKIAKCPELDIGKNSVNP